MRDLFNSISKEDNLLRKFEEIHDFIYSNDGLSPQQTLEEFVKVLFLKIVSEQEKSDSVFISTTEWDSIKRTGKSKDFFDRISKIFKAVKKQFPDLFDEDDKIKLSLLSLGNIINKLQDIDLSNSSKDAKGLAFQKFLSHKEKDGRGQFFTPEPVIDFCVRLLSPSPEETVIDPACGSGGFLMSTYHFIKELHPNATAEKIISSKLFGIEINKSIARIAKMKLLLEFNGKTNIHCDNSLSDLDTLKLKLNQKEGFDIVLANPPFGAKISNAQILSKFDLGHKWTAYNSSFVKTKTIHKNKNAEILFIERCLDLLKEGGRMGIVLPNGNFENPSLEYLREYIKLKSKILGIVNLPQETFIPYGTGVKTSLLFLEKDTPNKVKQYPVFFGRIKKLGYQGNKNGSPLYKTDNQGQILFDELGNKILDEDFSQILSFYKHFLNKKTVKEENAFSISYDELNGRFDYDFYAPENRDLLEALVKSKSVRLGDICTIVKQKSKKLKSKEDDIEYVELSDINPHANEIINSSKMKVHELPSRASYELKNGDIITAIAGNSVGTRKHATALVNEEYEGAICTNGFRIFRNIKIDKNYFLYFLKSDFFLKQMFMYRTGAAIPNVSDKDLGDILVYLPEEKEIEEISQRVKSAIELREKSKKMIDEIELELAN